MAKRDKFVSFPPTLERSRPDGREQRAQTTTGGNSDPAAVVLKKSSSRRVSEPGSGVKQHEASIGGRWRHAQTSPEIFHQDSLQSLDSAGLDFIEPDEVDEVDEDPRKKFRSAPTALNEFVDPEGKWFAGHVEATGRPRPLRPRTPKMSAEQRGAVTENLAMWASRVEAPRPVEREKRVKTAGRSRSEPNLLDEDSSFSTQAENTPINDVHIVEATPAPSPCAQLRCVVDFLCGTLHRRENDASPSLGRAKSTDSERRSRSNPYARPVIIFDWDDTLLPTSFITEHVLPNIPKGKAVSKDSPYYEELSAHAHLVEFVLRKASELTRVAIVTLSMDPWVLYSARFYLPGLNIKRLLRELGIRVYYSRPHFDAILNKITYVKHHWDVTVTFPEQKTIIGMSLGRLPDGTMRIMDVDENGFMAQWNNEHDPDLAMKGVGVRHNDQILKVNGSNSNFAEEFKKSLAPSGYLTMSLTRDVPDMDPHVEAKRLDMEVSLGEFYADAEASEWNVISIGDSVAEQQAVKEVFHNKCSAGSGRQLCKTVNLIDQPTVGQLSNELKVLVLWLPKMVQSRISFDWFMNKSEDLERKLLHLSS